MITGAHILSPNGMMRGQWPTASSSSKMWRWVGVQPVPPYSFGHRGAIQPFLWRIFCQVT